MKMLLKLFDLLAFCILGYFAVYFYHLHATTQSSVTVYQFDLINAVTILFVIIRRPDINTVTLGVILLAVRLIERLLLFDMHDLNGFIVYPLILILDILTVIMIWFRPVLFSNYGPFKGKSGYAVTRQDNAMWVLFALNAIFMLLMTLEHATRQVNTWLFENSRLLYNLYETIQLVFIVTGFVVLYYMTHFSSKKKRPDRPQFNHKPANH